METECNCQGADLYVGGQSRALIAEHQYGCVQYTPGNDFGIQRKYVGTTDRFCANTIGCQTPSRQ